MGKKRQDAVWKKMKRDIYKNKRTHVKRSLAVGFNETRMSERSGQ
jgi:hypothetical protein